MLLLIHVYHHLFCMADHHVFLPVEVPNCIIQTRQTPLTNNSTWIARHMSDYIWPISAIQSHWRKLGSHLKEWISVWGMMIICCESIGLRLYIQANICDLLIVHIIMIWNKLEAIVKLNDFLGKRHSMILTELHFWYIHSFTLHMNLIDTWICWYEN